MRMLIGGAVVIAAASGAIGWGFADGLHQPAWHTGSVHVSVQGKEATFFDEDGASGFFNSVAWIDSSGATHEGGWPACLRDHTTTAKYMTTDRLPDPLGFRAIVAVDCTQTH